ncbi:MAG: Lecithin-cholesterol acyltransferase [Parcubacteria group bacterium]|nr:Lecithin-cholesterol acyltransferase [Parcubacteria group bacterium]
MAMNLHLPAQMRIPLLIFMTGSLAGCSIGLPIPAEARVINQGDDSPAGMSNVLFLPGIEGSRLYEPAAGCNASLADCTERKLWDPSSDEDLKDLAFDVQGKSMHHVYTKERDSIDSIGPFKFYSSFVSQMDALKDAGTINDWQNSTYDWRLSLSDIVQNGAQHGTHIDYSEATDTPYIEQTLRSLAANSKTGKVTIIAHSNGALVAKALLMKLGDDEAARLVDAMIFVGAPQSGAPQALAGALHGYGTALPADWCSAWMTLGSFCAKDATRITSRALAENLPMTYMLLPSAAYFSDVQDALHPVISFIGEHLFASERAAYGVTLQNQNELIGFATNQDGSRAKPVLTDLATPNILNANLLAQANEAHDQLDAWIPPPSVSVYQLAGWGADTLSGIQYYEAKKASASGGYVSRYRPQFVEDGDSTVTIPSALIMPATGSVTRYWIDLTNVIALQPFGFATHANLLEISAVRMFIKNILSHSSDPLPEGITSTQPADKNPRKKLLFTLHGIARATLRNAAGQSSVINADGTTIEGIQNVLTGTFGDTHYMLAPVGEYYELFLDNTYPGSVDVDVQEIDGDTVTSASTFEDMPVGTDTPSKVDIAEDGTTTATSTPAAGPTVGAAVPNTSQPETPKLPVVVQTIRTKGIHNSQKILIPPKPIPVPKPKAVKITKVVTPKAKPLTKKAKAQLSTLLAKLTAQLQGLLLKLPR